MWGKVTRQIPHLSCHVRKGVVLKTIYETPEHSTTRMTEGDNLHVFDTMRQAAADGMDGVLMASSS